MIESLEDSKEELRRVDHLIFITLKYTRTGDVIINIIKRMINSFDHCFLSLLKYLKEKKKISAIPLSPIERVELINKNVKGATKYCKLYKLFKEIVKNKYEMKEEYRKHITLTSKGKKKTEINYNKIIEYFDNTKDFIRFVEDYIEK